ncbi:MAG TPA: nuclear transport factor 2 family protein [Thermoanaerobaculia bacterium]|jgi:uncharacterized protein (TIGR02246 family)
MRVLPLLLLFAAACATAPNPARDEETLRQAIVRSAAAFNANDAEAIISQYAPDALLSYPGLPDLDYDTLKKSYAEMVKRPAGSAHTTPTIEEVLVSGDLGVIRVRWTTTTPEGTRQMKDLQVWRRDRDGTWRFARGMHYRMPPA